MDILLLVMLVILNGVFAMSEIALVTARPGRLRRLAGNGDKAAALALELGEKPTRFLSTVQIGITAIGILSGIAGEAALSSPIAEQLQKFGLAPATSAITATTLVVVLVTDFASVFGDLVPKRIGQSRAEGIARRMARPIAWLAVLSYPFVLLLSFSTDNILRLLGKRDDSGANLTEEDIQAVLTEGARTGLIEKREHDLLRNVFRLDDRQIASLMTPRGEIVWLDVEDPAAENIAKLIDSEHSRFPVCRGGLHAVLGVVSAKRLLKQHLLDKPLDLENHLQPAAYVPESLTGMRLLEQFKDSGAQMVFVIDEYGDVVGLITLQDVMEALAGQFRPPDPDDLLAVRREDGSWLLDGFIPIPELRDRLGLKTVPGGSKGRYNTLSGMVMWLIGSMPRTGDVAEWEGWRFEVVDLDGNRIDKVLATRLPDK